MPRTNRGKETHLALMTFVSDRLRREGHRLRFDWKISGSAVDIFAEKDKETMAVECLVLPMPSVINRKIALFKEHVDRVIFVVPESASAHKIELEPPHELWIIQEIESELSTIRLKKSTIKKLNMAQAWYTLRTGENLSYDDLIDKLLERFEKVKILAEKEKGVG